MSYEDDDDLLAALGRAIGPDTTATPGAAELAALRAVVEQAGPVTALADADADVDADAQPTTVVPITRARGWKRRAFVGAGAVVIALSGTTAVAAAVNDGALPTPVRVAVRAVGLPVDSVVLAEAKAALKHLRTATDTEVAEALARAERELADLSASDRLSLGDDVDRTLADARERLAKLTAATAPTTAPTTVPTTVPATPVTPATPPSTTPQPSTGTSAGTSTGTSVDDRGGDDSSPDTSDGRGRGSDDSTPGGSTPDDSGSDGSSDTSDDRGGDDSSVPTAPGSSSATTDDSPDTTSGGGTDTTDDSGSGKGRDGDDDGR